MKRATNETDRITSFKGLNTADDQLTMGLSFATIADNVIITANGKLERTDGYVTAYTGAATGSIQGAYATKDLQRLYVIDNGSLKQLNTNMSVMQTLRTGLSSDPYYFDEVNGVVFFTNGTDYGCITADGARPWGIPNPDSPIVSISTGGSLSAGVYQVVCTLVDASGLESANSPVVVVGIVADNASLRISSIQQTAGYTTNVYATMQDGSTFYLIQEGAGPDMAYFDSTQGGRELPYWNTNTPRGTMPTYFGGRIYTAEYYPTEDFTVIWRSLPLAYHHFDPGSEGFMLPGQVMGMCATRETQEGSQGDQSYRFLIIGTDRAIHSWDDEKPVQLAEYGTVPGFHMTEHKGKILFWTKRGMCRALPFENLTESTVSVPPGLSAGGTVIEKAGTRRYVVALHVGGEAFNQYQ